MELGTSARSCTAFVEQQRRCAVEEAGGAIVLQAAKVGCHPLHNLAVVRRGGPVGNISVVALEPCLPVLCERVVVPTPALLPGVYDSGVESVPCAKHVSVKRK